MIVDAKDRSEEKEGTSVCGRTTQECTEEETHTCLSVTTQKKGEERTYGQDNLISEWKYLITLKLIKVFQGLEVISSLPLMSDSYT